MFTVRLSASGQVYHNFLSTGETITVKKQMKRTKNFSACARHRSTEKAPLLTRQNLHELGCETLSHLPYVQDLLATGHNLLACSFFALAKATKDKEDTKKSLKSTWWRPELLIFMIQNILVTKYGFSTETANNITQNFLKNFRKCPENAEFPLHDWRHMLWKKCLGEEHLELSGTIYCQWLKLRYKYLAPSSEVIALLESLRKTYYLAVITNGPSNSQWEKIKRLRLSQYFDLILVSGDLKWEKPNKNIFFQACTHLGVSPKECVMVGDKLEMDILGGIEAGLGGTVWVPLLGTSTPSDDLSIVPNYVINDVVELKCLLSSKVTLSDFRSNRVYHYLDGKGFDEKDGNNNGSDGS